MAGKLDDAFGHWFAGFTAGEGCFWLGHTRERRFQVHFEIHMRDDDAAILYTIAGTLGCGKVYRRRPKKDNPAAGYYINDIESLNNIVVPLFERYPLRAKKSQEFEIWKAAIKLIFSITRTSMVNTRWGWIARYTEAERTQLLEYVKLLKSLRRYKSEPIQMALPKISKRCQLPLCEELIRENVHV